MKWPTYHNHEPAVNGIQTSVYTSSMAALPDNLGTMKAIPKFVLWNGYFACNQCNEPNTEPITWCEHVREAVADGKDAQLLKPGLTINVPIMPEATIWAEVHIEDEEVSPGIARMEMLYKPEFANLKKVDLGYWNTGEGLWVMRTCIIDYVRSRLDPTEEVTKTGRIITTCPSTSTHNLPAKKWMTGVHGDLNKKWTCLWNIVMEGACTYCVQGSADPNLGGLGGPPLTAAPWNPQSHTPSLPAFVGQPPPEQCTNGVGNWPPLERCAYPVGHSGKCDA